MFTHQHQQKQPHLQISLSHPRCCGTAFPSSYLSETRSFIKGVQDGELEVLGWGEGEEVLYVAASGVCKRCESDLREAVEALWRVVTEQARLMGGSPMEWQF
jgi:hypothetical protein